MNELAKKQQVVELEKTREKLKDELINTFNPRKIGKHILIGAAIPLILLALYLLLSVIILIFKI